jgi:hypothetical protein
MLDRVLCDRIPIWIRVNAVLVKIPVTSRVTVEDHSSARDV